MSLLPAAMRLPDDITPLGKKVVPPAPPKAPDPAKVFEKGVHPNPDGTKTYVKPPLGPKPFFGFDLGAGDDLTAMVTYAHKAMIDAMMIDAMMLNTNPPIVIEESTEHKTASEILLKQRAAAERVNKDYPTPWPSPNHRVPAGIYDNVATGLRERWIGNRRVEVIRSMLECGQQNSKGKKTKTWGAFPDLRCPF